MSWCTYPAALFGVVLLSSYSIPLAIAESPFLVKEVVLSKSVENRIPIGVFSPSAYCEKDKNRTTAIPIVETSQTSEIFMWVKVQSSRTGQIRHSWHQQIEESWSKVSEINLPIRPSSGYRMWSKKTIHPERHRGEWMVVLSPADQPERVLCITRFTVR